MKFLPSIDDQARYSMTVTMLLAKAVALMMARTKQLYSRAGFKWDDEISFWGKNISDCCNKIIRDSEYLENVVCTKGETAQGQTDFVSLNQAYNRDAYKIARFACYVYNLNVGEGDELMDKAEDFMYKLSTTPVIKKSIIENLRLNEDKRTNSEGGTSS